MSISENDRIEHIPLRKLWDFATGKDKLGMPEHTHMLDCEQCRAGFRACAKSRIFEEAQSLAGRDST